MNMLLEEGYVAEKVCGSNFSYILKDNTSFLSTEYKVLQSQTNGIFVKCMKMLYNGKIQLYYMTNSYKSFAAMLPSMDADTFCLIITNLLSDIIEVKHNGFLSCQNIDLSFEHIYVDPSTYKVSLVYLPCSKKFYLDYMAFENEIRTKLIKLISGISTLSSPKTMQLSVDLSNGMLTVEDLFNKMKGVKTQNIQSEIKMADRQGENNVSGSSVRITAINAPERVEIEVTKDEFLIGRSSAKVDGVVSFNKMIGRVHCKINKNGNKVMITDLESSNGTYVNKIRLVPNKPCLLRNGDVIRLANSDFLVSIS